MVQQFWMQRLNCMKNLNKTHVIFVVLAIVFIKFGSTFGLIAGAYLIWLVVRDLFNLSRKDLEVNTDRSNKES